MKALEYAFERIKRQKPDQFELFYNESSRLKIESKEQQVETFTQSEDVGLNLRVLKDGRCGFAYTTSVEQEAIDQAIQTAMDVAEVMPRDENFEFATFDLKAYPKIDEYDEKGLGVTVEEKIERAKSLEKYCLEADPRIKGVRSASYSQLKDHSCFMDQQGSLIESKTSHFTTSITCRAQEGDDNQVGFEFSFSNQLETLDIKETALKGAKSATELLGSKTPKTMKCPAVLRNDVVADLISFLSSSFSAEQIEKGKSLLLDKEGKEVFSPLIHIIDDGTYRGGIATSAFDGEGRPTQKTPLVKEGTFVTPIFDSYYAKKWGRKSTSNATRGIKAPPSIGTTNVYLQKGDTSLNDLLKKCGQGVMITSLMGIHTANPVTGDFSLGASGILIENGSLGQPVRGFAVAGNVLNLLKTCRIIGNDLRFFGSVGSPSLLVENLSIGGE